jgi:hypothetical protein
MPESLKIFFTVPLANSLCSGNVTGRRRIVFIAMTDVTSRLPYDCVAKFPKRSDKLLTRENWQLRAHRVTSTLPINTLPDSFADIGESLFDGLSLRVAALEQRTNHYVPAVVFIPLQKDFEIKGIHFPRLPFLLHG